MPPRVFITGASSGIGAALAAHYAREGAVLGLCARRLGATQALLESLRAAGACYPVDVTDIQSVQSAAADFTRRFGTPDIVIANAGVGAGKRYICLVDTSASMAARDRAKACVPASSSAGTAPCWSPSPSRVLGAPKGCRAATPYALTPISGPSGCWLAGPSHPW